MQAAVPIFLRVLTHERTMLRDKFSGETKIEITIVRITKIRLSNDRQAKS